MRVRRGARYALIGGLAVLSTVAASLFLRAHPIGSSVVPAVLSAVLAYLGGYFWTRKARRASAGQRSAVLAAALLLAVALLVVSSRLAGRVSTGARGFMAVVCGAVIAAHLLGLTLGRRKRRRRKPPGRESALAHKYLDGLRGVEIGGSIHNPFGLNTLNIDYTASTDTVFKQAEIEIAGKALAVDTVASGDDLPLRDQSVDFVVSSHVLEHFPDPIKALKEWYRVIRPCGYVFMIVPHKERTFDRNRPRTSLAELIRRHEAGGVPDTKEHCSVWITEDVVELVRYLGYPIVEVQAVDDKAGNGFTLVLQKGAQAETA